ncbi:MAG: hypothetical protein AAF614_44765, partial [Chloroflexota bacterium]
LLFKPNDNRLVTQALDLLQQYPILSIGALIVMVAAIIMMANAGNTVEGAMMTLPAFQVVVLVLVFLFSGIILFYGWNDPSRPQRWRRIVIIVIAVALVVEAILQALATAGRYPKSLATIDSFDHYTPYSRIYQADEGFSNGLTNNYGRYAPDFQLLPDSYRIAILGDSFVEGIQLPREQNFGALLGNQLAATNQPEQATEVLSLGHPNLGPGMYLSEFLMDTMVQALEPDEAIILFDLSDDFQTIDRPGTGYPYFVYQGERIAEIDTSRQFRDIHRAEHYVFRSYKGFQPVLILRSNYLTARLISANILENFRSSDKIAVPVNEDLDLPNGFVFNATTNEEPLQIAAAQINMAQQRLDAENIAVKLVVNPVFTKEFYAQEVWNTEFGSSNLLLPETELRKTAVQQNIPFLGLGTYMQAKGLTPAGVQSLFLSDGLGHYSAAGHQLAAEAIYQCFYAQTLSQEDGCYLP